MPWNYLEVRTGVSTRCVIRDVTGWVGYRLCFCASLEIQVVPQSGLGL